jgi:hypothetical protein
MIASDDPKQFFEALICKKLQRIETTQRMKESRKNYFAIMFFCWSRPAGFIRCVVSIRWENFCWEEV